MSDPRTRVEIESEGSVILLRVTDLEDGEIDIGVPLDFDEARTLGQALIDTADTLEREARARRD